MTRNRILHIGCLIFFVLTALLYILFPESKAGDQAQQLIRAALPRLTGSAAILLAVAGERLRLFRRPVVRDLAVLLPALLVALDNLPWYALFCEGNRVERWDLVGWIALESLAVGLLEEITFRGLVLPLAWRRYAKTRRSLFLTVLIGSAAFGLIHLANLLEGAGLLPTLLQVGYSTLIGGMCAIVLLRTGNLIWCILLHAIFDFGGALPLALANGAPENALTVAVKVAIALGVGAWMIVLLLRTEPKTGRAFFGESKRPNETEARPSGQIWGEKGEGDGWKI